MTVFEKYSAYYDLLYKDKDYAGEAEYVNDLIRKCFPCAQNILDLGCGTGRHDEFLARKGFKVHGVDRSIRMIELAREMKARSESFVAESLDFTVGDIQEVRLGEKFDIVISLFHVLSYQTTNDDLRRTFESVNDHLVPGGFFIFDCWYGPAVLWQRPETKLKIMEDSQIKVYRIAQPAIDFTANTVEVNYRVLVLDKQTGITEEITESHQMRYLFEPEIRIFMEEQGFRVQLSEEFGTGRNPSFETWSVCFVGKKETRKAR